MLRGKKILAVVPARAGSKGIPFKNLCRFRGVPLVGLAGRITQEAGIFDRAVVSTDHAKIADAAREYGLEVPFLRPPGLSGDRVSDWEVLSHALEATEDAYADRYDIIVMLQPTSPLRTRAHVIAAVEKLIDDELDAVWTVSVADSKHHPFKALKLRDGRLEYYAPEGSTIIARQELEPTYQRNGAAYAVTRECLVRHGNIKGERTGAVVVSEPMVSIDTLFDLELAEWLSERGYEKAS